MPPTRQQELVLPCVVQRTEFIENLHGFCPIKPEASGFFFCFESWRLDRSHGLKSDTDPHSACLRRRRRPFPVLHGIKI